MSKAPARVSLPTNRRMMTILLCVAVFMYWISLYLYAPTLPTYVEGKVDTLASVGIILSMYGLWQAIVRLPLGIFADWMGKRKPFVIFGLALGGLGAYMLASAQDASGLLVARAITGLAAGTWVPLVVMFTSLFPPEEAVRASALLTFVGGVGRILATAVTGTLNNWMGYPFAFYLAAGAAILAIVAILPAREQAQPPKVPSMGNLARLLSRSDVLLPSVLSMILQYANWATTFSFVPILAGELGATDVTLSVLLSFNIAVVTFGNLIATTVVRRIGARNMVYLSFALLTVGTLGAAVAHSILAVFVLQFLIGFSNGIGYPVLMGMSIRNVEEAQRGTAMGFHQAVYAIGMFAGPALSGVLADRWGMPPMFVATAVVCLLLGLVGTRRLSRERSM
ncbi:MAG: MFS transporter [Anaerolineae bacterium]